jgi:hypothetical protein
LRRSERFECHSAERTGSPGIIRGLRPALARRLRRGPGSVALPAEAARSASRHPPYEPGDCLKAQSASPAEIIILSAGGRTIERLSCSRSFRCDREYQLDQRRRRLDRTCILCSAAGNKGERSNSGPRGCMHGIAAIRQRGNLQRPTNRPTNPALLFAKADQS